MTAITDEELTVVNAKEKLFALLTMEEIAIFYHWIRAVYRTNIPDIYKARDIKKTLIEEVGTRHIYSFAHYILFGYHIPSRIRKKGKNSVLVSSYQHIVSNVQDLKEKLYASSYAEEGAQWAHEVVRLSSQPITARNPHIGEIIVTTHALERFCERVYGASPTHKKKFMPTPAIVEAFLLSFKCAEPTEIDPSEKVKRIIRHRFEEADYFLNDANNLRFVVIKKDRIIVTVERPR